MSNLIQIDSKKNKETTAGQARELIGRFSQPSKMPCFSWSISADLCITGQKLAMIADSVCADCYARKGAYNWPSTVNAMERREEKLHDRKNFVDNFVLALKKQTHFRWFDSGDIQSAEMLEDIVEIARRTPTVKHWLPSKEVKIVADYLASGKEFPANLSVRLSAYMIDRTTASTVTGINSLVFNPEKFNARKEDVFYCQAPSQNGECKDCRACWSQDVKTVAYLRH